MQTEIEHKALLCRSWSIPNQVCRVWFRFWMNGKLTFIVFLFCFSDFLLFCFAFRGFFIVFFSRFFKYFIVFFFCKKPLLLFFFHLVSSDDVLIRPISDFQKRMPCIVVCVCVTSDHKYKVGHYLNSWRFWKLTFCKYFLRH